MIRRLITFASVSSLLLCAAIVVLWVRSYWHMDSVMWFHGTGAYGTESSRGVLTIVRSVGGPMAIPFSADNRWTFHFSHDYQVFDYDGSLLIHLGFGYQRLRSMLERYDTVPLATIDLLAVPHLLPIFVFSLLPGCALIRRTRRTQRPQGKVCRFCGYDLRASKDRCPECGTPVMQKTGN
jgi:hypothetical protein